MKLEVGMYVRLNSGHIDKIIQVNDFWKSDESGSCPPHAVGKRCHWIFEDMYKKASHNIIDLIEIGDYVDGLEIETIETIKKTDGTEVRLVRFSSSLGCYFTNKEIKTIVTKEQFEQMQYKVDE